MKRYHFKWSQFFPVTLFFLVIFLSLSLVKIDNLSLTKKVAAAPSSKLMRYPYLTNVVNSTTTTAYATVNWATDISSASGSVKWGVPPNCTTNTKMATRSSITVGTKKEYQWKATLTLSPNTEYCYRIYFGSTDLLDTDVSPTFRTHLPAGSTEPYTFAVLGDFGEVDSAGNNPDQANLMQQLAAKNPRFILSTGDVAYPSGTQTNYGDLVQVGANTSTIFGPSFWARVGATAPLYSVNGNHGRNSTFLKIWPQDKMASTSKGKYSMETYCCLNGTNSASYPSVWYAFTAGNARFYILDASWSNSNVGTADLYKNDYDYHWATTSAQYQWLKNDLETRSSTLKFALFHFPLYSDNATERSDTYLQGENSLEGLLAQNGVDIAFSGHAHIYQRNIKPHENSLINYITGGGGAKLQPVGSGVPCSWFDAYALGWSNSANKGYKCGTAPVPSAKSEVFHFLLVSVNGSQVTVTPYNSLGQAFDEQVYNF